MPAEKTISNETLVKSAEPAPFLQKRYQVQKILGQGSFGAAYLAEDVKLKRSCVIKQMHLPDGRSSKTLARYTQNFEQEAGLLAQLNQPGHPNIPEIYDYFTEGNGTYLVMKYIEGQSLKTLLEPDGTRTDWHEAAGYMIDVCSAVEYMHTAAHGPVIHRDIKPANILLGTNNRVWLVDYGLAKARPVEGSADLQGTQVSGSLGYSPLEQWMGQTVPASDVYAIGATLHHMVTGLHPARDFGDFFNFEKLSTLQEQLIPIRKVNKKLPRTLESIIIAATDADPEKRPNAARLKQELETLVAGPKTDVLFTFKNGQTAKKPCELADLCHKNRAEAQGYLYNGDFERWFRLINRHDLATAAEKAVQNEPQDQARGLKRFIKLAVPNLFLIRLGRFIKKAFKIAFSLLALAIVLFAVGFVGLMYSVRIGAQEAIRNYDWQFETLNFEDENRFSEEMLNEAINGFLIAKQGERIDFDLEFPNKILFDVNWQDLENLEVEVDEDASGAALLEKKQAHLSEGGHVQQSMENTKDSFIVTFLNLEDGKPHVYLTKLGYDNEAFFWLGGHLSQGINQGIDMAFEKAGVRITEILIDDDEIVFIAERDE